MGRNVHNTLKLKMMPSEARLKKFEIKKNKHTFYVNNHSPNIFPVLANFSLCQNKIPCVFPVWKKEEPNSLFSLCRGHPAVVKTIVNLIRTNIFMLFFGRGPSHQYAMLHFTVTRILSRTIELPHVNKHYTPLPITSRHNL